MDNDYDAGVGPSVRQMSSALPRLNLMHLHQILKTLYHRIGMSIVHAPLSHLITYCYTKLKLLLADCVYHWLSLVT